MKYQPEGAKAWNECWKKSFGHLKMSPVFEEKRKFFCEDATKQNVKKLHDVSFFYLGTVSNSQIIKVFECKINKTKKDGKDTHTEAMESCRKLQSTWIWSKIKG